MHRPTISRRPGRRAVLAGLGAFAAAGPVQAKERVMELSPRWAYIADTVMGGVSSGGITAATVAGRPATRLTGDVSLDNNGGFVQMAFDLLPDGSAFDASDWAGISLDVMGNGEVYDLRLRTSDLTRPWQSYRTEIEATPDWTTITLPFTSFERHRTDAPFDASKLRRVGVLGIGREFRADVAVAGVQLYR